MAQRGYLEVSDAEVLSGVEFAQKGKGGEKGYPPTTIEPDRLRALCNRTRKMMATGVSLYDAKTAVLNTDFRQRSKKEQQRRRAHSAAISHVFGKRSGYARKKPAKEGPVRHVSDDKGQYELAV